MLDIIVGDILFKKEIHNDIIMHFIECSNVRNGYILITQKIGLTFLRIVYHLEDGIIYIHRFNKDEYNYMGDIAEYILDHEGDKVNVEHCHDFILTIMKYNNSTKYEQFKLLVK